MTLSNAFILLVISAVLCTARGSLVWLNNGGYEDIVIAIDPDVKEDARIIESIQNMVKEASSYLFQATRKRLFMKSVKILIPSTWISGSNYSKPATETYDKADVIVASPYLKYGDDPYTLQYGQCGEPGRYIHFTPNFLLDDQLLAAYGRRGRVFVHEWAHLRWGVYDEYSADNPYYVAENTKIEATRCSVDIFGTNIFQVSPCEGGSCPTRACDFDPDSSLYEKGCVFLPDTSQFVQESIMYSQALTEITDFCDSHTHNREAPNLHNRMCNSRSTWEVIMNSADITSTPPQPDLQVPEPTFTLLQNKDRVVSLVLDVSGSMSLNNRIDRLHQAVNIFLTQIIETAAYVGIVQFASSTTIISPLTRIDEQERENLISLVPSSASNEMTNICPGILAALKVNKDHHGSARGTEIVLLTDGEDNFKTELCYPNITASGAIIHVIALGPYAEKELEKIADMTGGFRFSAFDNLRTNGLIDAFTGTLSVNGKDSQQAIQLESLAQNLQPSACLDGSVFIDNTVGNDTFFIVTWQTTVPNIYLKDPKETVYEDIQFTSDATSKLSRLQIPGTAERGRWGYSLCNPHILPQAIGITVTSKAAAENVPPILASCHMNQNTNTYPTPMAVYAYISQGFLPVAGAKVTAIIESENGNTATLELLDNGAGADITKNDGIYSRYFTSFSANGRHSLKVRAVNTDNKSRLTAPKNRALYIPGYVDNGKIFMNPSKPTVNDDDLQLMVGPFSRTASGGSFSVSNVPSGGQPDIYRPEKITDLEAQLVERRIVLSWTATGDDLDQGQASSYQLRMNNNLKKIKDNFESSPLVNIGSLTPSPAGSRETFTFAPEDVNFQNGTILYFAVIAIDKAAQKSEASNIAQSAFYNVPSLPLTTPQWIKSTTMATLNSTTAKISSTSSSANPPNASSNARVITLSLVVCGSLILICLLVCIVICICCRKKKKQKVIC
ncbi:calcium-activated chloride channel regulator 1-like isoform X1 [Hyperolius riggenbachi]|uniref:calcium-activated chloride channel regulator 1-like isoform X1 n=1 Tax=Hyperolius riggenbachi TaxID=752182 RepID=UPI0035A2D230